MRKSFLIKKKSNVPSLFVDVYVCICVCVWGLYAICKHGH